jgi:hypothetical protein
MTRLLTALIAASILLGCATQNVADLRARTDNQASWTVSAPVRDVYRTYKEHIRAGLPQGFLWSGRPVVSGDFYGDSGEFTVRLQGNAIGSPVYLYTTMVEAPGGTDVTVSWSRGWKSTAMELRGLDIAGG